MWSAWWQGDYVLFLQKSKGTVEGEQHDEAEEAGDDEEAAAAAEEDDEDDDKPLGSVVSNWTTAVHIFCKSVAVSQRSVAS